MSAHYHKQKILLQGKKVQFIYDIYGIYANYSETCLNKQLECESEASERGLKTGFTPFSIYLVVFTTDSSKAMILLLFEL